MTSGLAQWAFEGSEFHAELLADGWEESRARKWVHGEFVSVLMVKMELETLMQIHAPKEVWV